MPHQGWNHKAATWQKPNPGYNTRVFFIFGYAIQNNTLHI